MGLLSIISKVSTGSVSAVLNAGQSVTTGVVNTTQNVIAGVADTTASIAGTATDAVKTVVTTAVDTTQSVTGAIVATTLDAASAVVDTAETGASVVLDTATNVVSEGLERAENVAQASVDAVEDTASTFAGATRDTVNDQLQGAVTAVEDGVGQITGLVTGSVDAVENIVGSGVQTVASAVETVTDAGADVLTIVGNLAHFQISLDDYLALGTGVAGNVAATISDAQGVVGNVLTAAQGGGVSLGDSDGLLGINAFASLLGDANSDINVIPDTRGSFGPLPVNVGADSDSVFFGAEIPVSYLLGVIVPPLLTFNLGGVGVVTDVSWSGFDVKVYGAAGPTFNYGPVSAGASTEVGNYTEVNLLSWNSVELGDLPIVGGVLGLIPVVGSVSVPVPSLDPGLDSKLYSQTLFDLNAFDVGPQGQVEAVHDLDNDVSLIAAIVVPTLQSAASGVGQIALAALGFDGTEVPSQDVAPVVQIVGNDMTADAGLWAV